MSIPMHVVAAAYKTSCRMVITGTGWQKLLDANPLRYYLRVEHYGPVVGSIIVHPNGLQEFTTGPGFDNLPLEKKFLDCPSVVTGEWYIFTNGVESIIVIEDIQLPG